MTNDYISDFINADTKLAQSWIDNRIDGNFDKFGIAGGDELCTWQLRLLRFSDQLPAISYAYGISFSTLLNSFTEIYSEEQSNGRYNSNFSLYNIYDQSNFINQNSSRTPMNVLDIGGGRGEIAALLHFLGCKCTSIEPGIDAEFFYHHTGKHFFGMEFDNIKPILTSVREFSNIVNIEEFDTIIFCESIEHLNETEFYNFWEKIKKKFKGLVIISNVLDYHPIPADCHQHIFEINDWLYNKLIVDSDRCVYRNGSHLVLEFK